MPISIARGRDRLKPRALSLHSAAMLLLVELLLIFAALGLGAVGVVKTVDCVLDEQASIFSLSVLLMPHDPPPALRARFSSGCIEKRRDAPVRRA